LFVVGGGGVENAVIFILERRPHKSTKVRVFGRHVIENVEVVDLGVI